MTKNKIGWIGVGNMGEPMALNLLKAGYSVNIYRRKESKPSVITQQGATAFEDLSLFIEQSDIIFLTLPDDAIVEAVFSKICTKNIAHKVFINSSTISPSLAIKLAKAVEKTGGHYVDAPVSGSVKPAQEGTLSFLIGSTENQYTTHIPLFEILGKHHYHLGQSGAGSQAKLAINYYMSVVIQGLAETVRFAEDQGISRAQMTAIINDGACGSPITKIKTEALLKDEYPAAFPLKFMLKDIRLAMAEGLASDLIKATEKSFNEAADQGLSDLDLMAVIKTIK